MQDSFLVIILHKRENISFPVFPIFHFLFGSLYLQLHLNFDLSWVPISQTFCTLWLWSSSSFSSYFFPVPFFILWEGAWLLAFIGKYWWDLIVCLISGDYLAWNLLSSPLIKWLGNIPNVKFEAWNLTCALCICQAQKTEDHNVQAWFEFLVSLKFVVEFGFIIIDPRFEWAFI